MPTQISVNPACSKCRTAPSLLDEHDVDVETVRSLDEPPTVADLKRLMGQLDDQARDALLEAITRHPM